MQKHEHRDKTVAQIISELKNATPDQIEPYLYHNDVYLRMILAGMPQLTEDQVKRLAQDETGVIRIAISSRSDLPLELQHHLANDVLRVKEALAKNHTVSPLILERLYQESIDSVLASIATNPNCSVDLQLRLASSGRSDVLLALAKRRDMEQGLGRVLFDILSANASEHDPVEIHKTPVAFLAHNPKTPPDLLASLASNDQFKPQVRTFIEQALLDNPGAPQELLRTLRSQYLRGNAKYRSALASTQHTPLPMLIRLAFKDSTTKVRQDAMSTLQRMPDHIIETQLSSGAFSLNHAIGRGTNKRTLGDCLLGMEMSDLYQRIQGLELNHSIKSVLQAIPAGLATPASSARHRML